MSSKRVLAIDYGSKRIGVAVSDPLGITAQGLPNVDNDAERFENIRKITEEKGVSLIIVGLPRRLDGTLGQSAQEVKKFGDELRKKLAIEVKYWEEWLSTAEAERHLINADRSRKKRKGLRDRIAAQLILQGYLDSKRGD